MMRPKQRKSPNNQQVQQRAGESSSSSSSNCRVLLKNNSTHNIGGYRRLFRSSLSPRSSPGSVSTNGEGGGSIAVSAGGGESALAVNHCATPATRQRRRLKRRSSSAIAAALRRQKLAWKALLSAASSSPRLRFIFLPSLLLACLGFVAVLSSLADNSSNHNGVTADYHSTLTRRRSSGTTPYANSGGGSGGGVGVGSISQNWNPTFQRRTEGAPSCGTDLYPDGVSYTLVTQLSHDRIWMLEHHCQRWGQGRAMSVAVYTNESAADVRNDLVKKYRCDADPSTLQVQTLPIVYDQGDYPVNELRNLAFSAVKTTHIVYVDVDFWGGTDLYDTLMVQDVRSVLAESHRNALVIPALSLKRQCGDHEECPDKAIPLMPKTREQAIPLILNHSVTAFDPTNFGGHGSTRYAEWLQQQPDQLLPIECVHSNRYEPYLVVRYCADLPPFQTVFSGYGKNKMTWFLQLRREGYSLYQIASFLVHYPHMDSKARLVWNGGSDGKRISRPKGNKGDDFWLKYKRGRNDMAFVRFREWLKRDIEDRTRIGSCKDAMDVDDDAKLWVDHDAAKSDEEGGLSPSKDHGGVDVF